jgi:hypothetical protein
VTNPNDPAFPEIHSDPEMKDYHGLTKREWLAGLAMQGLLANGLAHERGFTVDKKEMPIVDACVFIADVLIAALNTPKETEK